MAIVSFSVRIEQDLKSKIEELAELNYRSLNGEINKALDFYISYFTNGNNTDVIPVQTISEPKRTITDLKNIEIDEF